MTVFVIIFSLIMLGVGGLVKRSPELISGYNTMSAEKRQNVDLQAVGNLLFKGFRLIAGLMIAAYFACIAAGLRVQSPLLWLLWLAPLFIITLVLLVLMQKYDKNPRGWFAKYWSVGLLAAIFAGVALLMLKNVPPVHPW